MIASVFIPTGNRAKSLERVLKSLVNQSYKKFEVIIVDYKSTDRTESIINKFSQKLRIKVIHQKKKGLAQAANMALKSAKGSIFIRTDDDVKMSRKWLEAIVNTFKSDVKVGGVTGPTIIPRSHVKNRDLFKMDFKFRKGNVFWKLIGKLYFGFFMEGQPRKLSHWFDSGAFSTGSNFSQAKKASQQEVTNLEACNFAVRTSLLNKIGQFSTSYTGLGEYHEPDAALKIKHLGYKLIFNPKAMLNHLPSKEGFFSDRPGSYSRMINFIIFYRKNIKINSYKKAFRFFMYLLFLDLYYIYTAIITKQVKQLGAIPATIVGFLR